MLYGPKFFQNLPSFPSNGSKFYKIFNFANLLPNFFSNTFLKNLPKFLISFPRSPTQHLTHTEIYVTILIRLIFWQIYNFFFFRFAVFAVLIIDSDSHPGWTLRGKTQRRLSYSGRARMRLSR